MAGLFGGLSSGLDKLAERKYKSERDEAEFLRKKALMKYGVDLQSESLLSEKGSGYHDPDTLKEISEGSLRKRGNTEGLLSGRELQAHQTEEKIQANVRQTSLLAEEEQRVKDIRERESLEKAWPKIAKKYKFNETDEATKQVWIDSAISDIYYAKLGEGVSTEVRAKIISDSSKAWDEMPDHDIYLAEAMKKYGKLSPEKLEIAAKTEYLGNALVTQVELISSKVPGESAARGMAITEEVILEEDPADKDVTVSELSAHMITLNPEEKNKFKTAVLKEASTQGNQRAKQKAKYSIMISDLVDAMFEEPDTAPQNNKFVAKLLETSSLKLSEQSKLFSEAIRLFKQEKRKLTKANKKYSKGLL